MATVDTMQRNVELARRGYAAFETGDVQAVMDLLNDEVVWHNQPNGPLPGDYRGKQQVMEFFGKFLGLVDSQSNDVHDILASPDHTVVVGTTTIKRKGQTLTQRFVDVMHPDSDGRVKEFWRMLDDPAAGAALLEN